MLFARRWWEKKKKRSRSSIIFLQASVLTTSPETRSPPSIFPFDDDVETRSPPSICPFDNDIICIQPTVGIEGGAWGALRQPSIWQYVPLVGHTKTGVKYLTPVFVCPINGTLRAFFGVQVSEYLGVRKYLYTRSYSVLSGSSIIK